MSCVVRCRGNLLLDCTMFNGSEVCFPEGGNAPEQCAPVQTPVSAALSTLMQDGQVSSSAVMYSLPCCKSMQANFVCREHTIPCSAFLQ